jgi:zinc transport system ATP-binding protein
MSQQIKCENIKIAYEKEDIIKDLSIIINKGDYISIIGENGAGKSSLVKGILGLIPLKDGKVSYLNGIKRNSIGYLSQQNNDHKNFPASVFEVVLSGYLNKKGFNPFYNHKIKEMAKANLKLLGMKELLNKSFSELSGGQRQRVLLARALSSTDSIMFLDEPVTGLDPIATKELYLLIEKLNKEMGITIVMVTHDIKNALNYSEKILHLKKDSYFYGLKKEYTLSGFGNELNPESGE